MNPQFSTSAVEAPQVVDSFPLSEDFADVIFQEIPEVQVVERIQEHIVEPIEVLPQEREQQHSAIQIMHVPVPQIQEQHRFGEHTISYHCC